MFSSIRGVRINERKISEKISFISEKIAEIAQIPKKLRKLFPLFLVFRSFSQE